MGLTRVLGGILLLALLHNPSPAFSAVLPGSPSVTMQWDPSSSPEVTGYRIYYGTTSGDYSTSVVVGNAPTNTVAGLTVGVTYYFAVVAYNASGVESPFSNEIAYIVPGGSPTVALRMAANRQAILTVTGQSGHTYDIQASQTLATWAVIGTVTLGAGSSVDFTDTNAASFPQRFYRTRDTQP